MLLEKPRLPAECLSEIARYALQVIKVIQCLLNLLVIHCRAISLYMTLTKDS